MNAVWLGLSARRRRSAGPLVAAHIVDYADNHVICCRGSAAASMAAMQTMMAQLQLTVNEAKTSICHVPEGRPSAHCRIKANGVGICNGN